MKMLENLYEKEDLKKNEYYVIWVRGRETGRQMRDREKGLKDLVFFYSKELPRFGTQRD